MSSLPADPLSVLSSAAAAVPPMHGMKTRRLSASASSKRRADARDALRAAIAPKTPLLISSLAHGAPATEPAEHSPSSPTFKNPDMTGGSGGAAGRRRGTIFKCESCSKVYRHPSCLIKHRWEHSPHWTESSKLLLSKHQQVQLLEGAAILSYLGTGSSLPEDRAVWPSWTSGGALPLPAGSSLPEESALDDEEDDGAIVSSSVPMPRRGPIKAGFATPAHAVVREVAPGVLVAPSPPRSSPRSPQLVAVRGNGTFSEVRPGVLMSTAPIAIKREPHSAQSPSSPGLSVQSPSAAGLEALASLSLSLSSRASSSLPQSSLRSSSGGTDDDEPELPELDDDDMELDAREHAKDEWDGAGMAMELDMDF